MAADEEVGWHGIERVRHRPVVVARIAADMLQQYVGLLTTEASPFGIAAPHVASVDIAMHGTKDGLHRLKAVRYLHRSDVSGVPDLITLAEVLFVPFVPIAMGVADDTDTLHGRWRMNCSINCAVCSMPRTEVLTQRS